MNGAIRTLYIDDDPVAHTQVQTALAGATGAFELITATRRAEVERLLSSSMCDLVLSEVAVASLGLGQLEVLELVKLLAPGLPVVFLTGSGSEEIAVEALLHGAGDYLVKNQAGLAALPGRLQAALGRQRAQADHARIEAELRLRDRAIAATSDGVIITDATLRDNPIIYCNPAFERITGYSAAEVIGRNCRFLQGNGSERGIINLIRDAVYKGRDCRVTLTNYRKDGTPFLNALAISPIYDSQGRMTHFVGIQTDVTELERAERELHHSETLLARVFDASPAAMALTSADGRYLDVNPSFLAITGYRRDEVVGRAVVDLRLWEDEQERATLIAVLEGLAHIPDEVVRLRSNSGIIHYVRFTTEQINLPGAPCRLAIIYDTGGQLPTLPHTPHESGGVRW